MSRITNLFKNKPKDILNIYFTAGYPALEDTVNVLESLQEAGVDMVEIGLPFSDPLADGPVIQRSSHQALENGMSLNLLFSQLKDSRKSIHFPIVLMGYLNPIMQYGIENFLKECQTIGIDGLILPDLPLEEYEAHYQSLFKQYGVDNILLVTPETSQERLRRIDKLSSGFIYAVSSSSTTGTDKDWDKQKNYFKNLKDSALKNPILTGFGVKNKETFKAATQYTNGAIIGSAFVKTLQAEGALDDKVKKFISGIIS